MKNKNGQWFLDTWRDMIGWSVFHYIDFDENSDRYILSIEKNDTHEIRVVHAKVEAIPVESLEMLR